MPRSNPPYAPEYRRQMIELVRAGRTPEELTREFEPSAQAIRNWVVQGDRDEGRRGDGPPAHRARVHAVLELHARWMAERLHRDGGPLTSPAHSSRRAWASPSAYVAPSLPFAGGRAIPSTGLWGTALRSQRYPNSEDSAPRACARPLSPKVRVPPANRARR